ncbi:MAG: 2-dehydro-3-deoxygalactonokinase [Reyranellaceae bacterium]
MSAALIALDWGTSSLRGWLLDGDGTNLDRRAGGPGILAVADGGFAGAHRAFVAGWPELPSIASGMIGSKQGWVEAPYVNCPGGFVDLSPGLRATPDAALSIVPGVAWQVPGLAPDVMRGEETQIFGALDADDASGLFILPGTHSKWARVADGRIVSFATYMTGEIFAVLRQHSILGRLMAADAMPDLNAAAFEAGAEVGLHHGDDLLHRLFEVRTLGLFERLSGADAPSYLSGLLIGAEIAAALHRGAADSPTLVGARPLCAAYRRVLAVQGIDARIADEDVTPRGLWRIARAAGMIG